MKTKDMLTMEERNLINKLADEYYLANSDPDKRMSVESIIEKAYRAGKKARRKQLVQNYIEGGS